jgi:hypothetical protein
MFYIHSKRKKNLIAPFASLLKIYFLNLAIFQVQGRNDISVTFFYLLTWRNLRAQSQFE